MKGRCVSIRRGGVLAVLALLVAGCATVKVVPLNRDLDVRHVCIEENPAVQVSDFVDVVRVGFERHGIKTEVYTDERPDHCEYILFYTARRSWDFKAYLAYAQLYLSHEGHREVARAEYKLGLGDEITMMKFAGTRKKMDPVIEELLGAY